MVKLFIDLGSTNIKYKVVSKEITKLYEFNNSNIYFDKNNNISVSKLVKWIKKLLFKLYAKYNEDIKLYFSSAMHTLVVYNPTEETEAKVYSLIDEFKSKNSYEEYIANRSCNGLVNNWFLPIYKLRKIIKVKETRITTLKSYILLKLLDINAIEVSDAAGLGLVNFKNLNYDKTLLKFANLEVEQLPKIIINSTTFIGKYSNYNLAINLGCSDGASASLAIPNNISMSIGTTMGLRIVIDKPITPIFEFDYCFPIVNKRWVYGISYQNGGNVIDFLLKKMNYSYKIINSKFLDKVESYNEKIQIFEERFDLKNDCIETRVNLSVLKGYIDQMVSRCEDSFLKIKKQLHLNNVKCYATGGIFNNTYVNEKFSNIFKNNIIIKVGNNLSIEGLKKIEEYEVIEYV